ncbi:MAG: nuclear transport factor 2 family protein [Verrucomicrobiaceae bacterium]|nr:nuclear transport factor 2 family protein [Verrucomicrobiaceae bacterium]
MNACRHDCRVSAGRSFILAVLVLSSCTNAVSSDEAAVRSFLESYFSTWSVKDMERYGACFDPQARITFVGKDGRAQSDGLTDFLHGQKLAHAQASTPMSEIPTEMKITFDRRVTLAAVRWKLTKGGEVVTGTDNFTLIKTEAGWKIISLVFFND